MKGETKAVIISIVLAIPLWIVLFLGLAYILSGVFESFPQKNLSLMETKYSPALNITVVNFANIGSKTLYNITVVSEFGEISQFPLEVKAGQGFQVGLEGKVSKVTVQYATEPDGKKQEEKFEWTW